ncbi:MAG: RIO1 family regulatory kinase/ATPase [Thermoplasmatales archaeon]
MYSNSSEEREKVEKRLKETQKVFGYVFDRTTLLNIYKLFTSKVLDRFEFPIASGKESIVFAASSGGKFYAVKIYKTVASTFKNIERYAGQRWDVNTSGNRRKFIGKWAYQEFRNLRIASDAGVLVPKPVKVSGSILVMQYLGTKRRPSTLLKDYEVDEKIMKECINSIRKLYLDAGMVHGDLSEYNFLIFRRRPYMIDMAQAVSTRDEVASFLLKRDVRIIAKFFNKIGFELQENKLLKYITGEKDVFY